MNRILDYLLISNLLDIELKVNGKIWEEVEVHSLVDKFDCSDYMVEPVRLELGWVAFYWQFHFWEHLFLQLLVNWVEVVLIDVWNNKKGREVHNNVLIISYTQIGYNDSELIKHLSNQLENIDVQGHCHVRKLTGVAHDVLKSFDGLKDPRLHCDVLDHKAREFQHQVTQVLATFAIQTVAIGCVLVVLEVYDHESQDSDLDEEN